MAYTPTPFVDRAVQYPGRRLLTPVSGIANTYDVTRAEGTIFEVGTEIDEDNLNAEFNKIKVETDFLENANTYSSTEKVIGKFDGKPLYAKTVLCGALPNASAKNVAHGISNLKYVVNKYGFATNGTANKCLPYVHTSNINNQIGLETDDLINITLVTQTNYSAYTTSYVTLEYTKTTD